MKKKLKCQQGFFCINYLTLFLTIILISFIGYLLYNNYQKDVIIQNNNLIQKEHTYTHHHNNLLPHSHIINTPSQSGYDMLRPIMNPRVSYNESPTDTLMNPYSPPLHYNQPHTYKQIGYLKNETHSHRMFPIFAKPLHLRRDKWYYYTIYDNIKLPIYSKGRKCSSEHGCDSLMDGDSVFLENMNDVFIVSLYDNHTLTYDPAI
tara:strand:+ start:5488 stop:6102 length:615 start_codon:yes stop_codon:yes gene_type:complete